MKKLGLIFLAAFPVALVAEIDNLAFLGHNAVNFAHLMDAEIVNTRTYVSVGVTNGLEVYDITDPANPQRLYALGPASWRSCIYYDTLLFSFCRRNGVVLYNIAGPGQPVQVGQYNPPGNLEALEGGTLRGNILHCAAHQNGIYAVDFTNPANPVKVGQISLDTSAAWNVAVKDSFLYVANGRFGLAVVGIQGSLHLTAKLALPGTANDILLDGNTAVVALGADGLATANISDPHNPLLLDTIKTAGCVWGSGISGHDVIAGSWRVMELFDVSAPSSITKSGWDNTSTWALGAAIRSDDLIGVADWEGMSCYQTGSDPGGDIDVDPLILDFGAVVSSVDTGIIVRNTGASDLNVSSITAPAGINSSPANFTVPAGDSQFVTVTATGAGPVSGAIVFNSNDPDEPGFTTEVYKNNTGFPQYGSVAPDFTLPGTDGQNHTLSLCQGKVVLLQFGGGW